MKVVGVRVMRACAKGVSWKGARVARALFETRTLSKAVR